jgi:hypothetical protein
MEKKNKSTKQKKTNNSINENNGVTTLTDDNMINEVLLNMGKKSKNPVKKELINNFVNDKFNNTGKKNNTNNNNLGEEKKTFTGNLTKEEINEKLQDYKLVDDISKVPLGTHLRYFVIKDGVKLFRMGGNLKRNLDLPKFIVLVNAVGTEWTVQIKNTTFYKKMSLKEIKEEYDGIIEELHEKIKKYKKKIEDKNDVIIELQDTINTLKKNKKK